MTRRAALGPDDFVLCAGTLARTPLEERIPIIAEAGYDGLSVFTTDLEGAGAAQLAELRARIEEAGLAVAEIDPLMRWYPSAPAGSGFFAFDVEDALGFAEGLGARGINAVAMLGEPGEDELVTAFADLCRRADERGLLVHLEFMPFSRVRSLADAARITQAAGCANGGIMLDVWHLARSGGSVAQVRAVAEQILAVQLDDAPKQAEEDLFAETMHRRRLPGEGDADVVGILRALHEGGSRAPLGVEVFADELARLPADEVARRTLAATRRVHRVARSG